MPKEKRKRPHSTFTLEPKIKLAFQNECYLAGLDMSNVIEIMMESFTKSSIESRNLKKESDGKKRD